MLQINTPAPDFTLINQYQKELTLSELKGKNIVLYFYPKDNTPGCTKEACAFASAYEGFKQQDVLVLGVSKDSVKSHQKFADNYHLPFILLSDPSLEVMKAYDVWKEKKLYGKSFMGVKRITYLIDREGIIRKVYEKVDPTTHAQTILEDLKEL